MYTDKKSILQLAVLLRAHGIRQVVLCPGSRDIPLVRTLASIPEFTCYPITDERSAGFFALGLSLQGERPAAVVCTSGTSLLNLHPAVAEAFYQQVPLVVISADRPEAWIGQMDGQTLPQPGVFGRLVKRSVQLPEVSTDEDEWYCNRLINEALLELDHHGRGPVHINVPISDPFFQCPVTELPHVRVITRYQGSTTDEALERLLDERLRHYRNRMVVVGQMNPVCLANELRTLDKHFVWLAESISNQALPGTPIQNIEPLLYAMDAETQELMRPELLITYGGHIISKRLKNFLRCHPPKEHWHISADGEVMDLYGSLTSVIEMDPFAFFKQVASVLKEPVPAYPKQWETLSDAIPQAQFDYSEMGAIGAVISRLPNPCSLHLANSSTVRYAQLFKLPAGVEVLSNRGTNGIEGSLSTAIGYASASEKLNFILIGDLSFFYDMNALWNTNYRTNIRILLLNNSGGEIFHALPGLKLDDHARRFVTATHQTSAKAWAEDCGFKYLSACNAEELDEAVNTFVQPVLTPQPLLLEVFTSKDCDIEQLKAYYHNLKH